MVAPSAVTASAIVRGVERLSIGSSYGAMSNGFFSIGNNACGRSSAPRRPNLLWWGGQRREARDHPREAPRNRGQAPGRTTARVEAGGGQLLNNQHAPVEGPYWVCGLSCWLVLCGRRPRAFSRRRLRSPCIGPHPVRLLPQSVR